MSLKTYLAVDLGAGSGRVMAGHFDGKKLRIEEINRFANEGTVLPTGSHWKVLQLFSDIKSGLAEARSRHGDDLVSVAVDTWGVDYGLVDASGRLLGFPWMYRDSRTDGAMEAIAEIMPREEIYRRTGIQFMFFNTLFQLFAEARQNPAAMAAADQLLFMPDLLTYWLSGHRITERTIASTAQMLKVGSGEWDLDLARVLGIRTEMLQPTSEPGLLLGPLLKELQEETGCKDLQVTTCGSHDTASAVAGIPTETAEPLFLSSGTWSLIGRELKAPIVTDASYKAGFSNEQGLDGTTRFLKNIAGMWLLQECKRTWDGQGKSIGFGELVTQARHSQTTMLLDPDAADFAKPCDMPAAIQSYAARTGQAAPSTQGEFTKVILESLALKYRNLVGELRAWMPDLPDTLHIVGGGSQNALLNQMAADATGLRVVAGPVEATAAGNVLAQLLAAGEISSLTEGREILRTSFEPDIFEPADATQWQDKAAQFESLLQSS